MYLMCWKIKIGKYELGVLNGVTISKTFGDLENAIDTATISLPRSRYNQTLEVETKISKGDKVVIELGYNDQFEKEFEGYLSKISFVNKSDESGGIKLICSSALYLCTQPLEPKQFKGDNEVKNLTDAIEYLLATSGTGIKLGKELTKGFKNYTLDGKNVLDGFNNLRKQFKLNYVIKDKTLFVYSQYAEYEEDKKHEIFKTVKYDFSKNVEKSDELVFAQKEDKILVEATAVDQEGNEVKEKYGDTGGQTFEIKISGHKTSEEVKRVALDEWRRKTANGYTGKFTTWLVPYIEPGYMADIIDNDNEYRKGLYRVSSVTTIFNEKGASRIIEITKKAEEQKKETSKTAGSDNKKA